MDVTDVLGTGFIVVGAVFFLAGTVGLLRFPDAPSRLHALTKADNLGLGFVALGLVVLAGSPAVMVKLGIIWLLAVIATATTSQLIASVAIRGGDLEDREGG